ncbi:MAG: ATP-binding protein [Dehalococcoidia bacterium]|nr:MAG: ATP-binding protein [Dehalococcoidia bacterium]
MEKGLHNQFWEQGRLGIVVSGSLTKGLEVKLDSATSVEDIAVGRYVTIESERRRFFGMITDVTLDAIDPRLMVTPPDVSDPFIAEVVAGTSTFGRVHVLPELTWGGDAISLLEGPQPVKTVPAHFSVVREASEQDVERVFGQVEEKQFWIGTPLDMEIKVRLDPAKLVERSSGVFGKTGTGKTFLARLLLIGIIQEGTAANLVFDMHSEYGWEGTSAEGRKVKALKQLFPSKIAVFALDEESARRRKVSTDFVVEIGYDDIEPEDIEMLGETLNLTEAAVQAPYRLARHFGDRKWLEGFLALEGREQINELALSLGEHEATLASLRRRLEALRRLRFLVPHARDNPIQRILEYLDRGINVVLEFGRYTDITAYVLVANLLTRRIHTLYRERMERAMGEDIAKPRPLVITIEEAHKFLSPQVATQTIFGTIAREMRKYNVTLLVIDQRPSGIDEEVMSQIGTKITCLLDNERDIESVLTGVSGKSEFKAVLAKLETRQQALIFGHAVPMPVVVRTREYGSPQSYKELGFREAIELKKEAEKEMEDLWG